MNAEARPALPALTEHALDPLFWRPSRLGTDSAWYGHVPFGHWIVAAHRPSSIVELGAHNGVSYAAFCEAVLRCRLDARALAIDTWQGDEHAGFYGDEVYADLRAFNDQRYAAFSTLLRASFDDALPKIADASIDLLHIDGRHRYEDVAHDFTSWTPKLSRRAVVLFHDTNVREQDFGVYRLWAELRTTYPAFEFLHGHGLGVLAVGPDAAGPAAALCALADPDAINTVRERFALLGERWVATRELQDAQRAQAALAADMAATKGWATTAQDEVNKLYPLYQALTETHRGVRANLARARHDVAARERELAECHASQTLRDRQAAEREAGLAARSAAEAAAQLAHQAAAHAAELAAIRAELADTRATLDNTHLALHGTQAALEGTQATLDTTLAALDGTRAHLGATEAALAGARVEVGALEDARAQVMRSTSWRVTAPLRRALGAPRPGKLTPRPAAPLALAPPAAPPPAPPPPAPPDAPAAETQPIPAAEIEPPSAASPEIAPADEAEPALAPVAEPSPTANTAAAPPEAEPQPAPDATPATHHPELLFLSGEDHTPGHTYRIERYVAAARALGLDAGWSLVGPVGPTELAGIRLVVLWRVPYSEHIAGIIQVTHEQGGRVVFDVDDLMFRPELATIEVIDGIRSQHFSEPDTRAFFGLIARSLHGADLVTCPTEELAHQARLRGRPAFVLPNGFDAAGHDAARRAHRDWVGYADDVVRIGYAGGSRTHQRDFAAAAPALARVLRAHPDTCLTLFRDPASGEGLVLIDEFEAFADLAHRIEWRDMVPLADLPRELARFAINIAPLQAGNEFCEAKSELKFWEAALAGAPTIASPTGPYRRAIEHGVTGLLADTEEAWFAALTRLVGHPAERARLAQAAYHVSLARFGPEARAEAFGQMLALLEGGQPGADAFERQLYRNALPASPVPHVPEAETLFAVDRLGQAAVTVIVPVFNYADYVPEALQSVFEQTLPMLDLVVVEDASPDDSGAMVLDWVRAHEHRFNRVRVLRHRANAGLGFARNSGFAAAESPFVLPLDADNRLHPTACATLLARIEGTGAAFAYPAIRKFGEADGVVGQGAYSVLRLQPGNYIDAMALVRKSAWARAGGYDHVRHGWEDFDFWARIAERGGYGLDTPEILADYRVHNRSMLHTTTEVRDNREALVADLERRHPWLDVAPGVSLLKGK